MNMLTRRRWLTGAAGAVVAAVPAWAAAADAAAFKVQRVNLAEPPALPLTTMVGDARRLDRELAVAAPLVLNFVFTTCSSSCSLQTAVLAQVQQAMAQQRHPLRLASITIDPDNDTPEQLRQFSARFGVGQGWQFYTGRFDDLLAVQRHFDVYRGSKAAHPPVLMLRGGARAPWVRVEGFPSAADVMSLLRKLPVQG